MGKRRKAKQDEIPQHWRSLLCTDVTLIFKMGNRMGSRHILSGDVWELSSQGPQDRSLTGSPGTVGKLQMDVGHLWEVREAHLLVGAVKY